MSKTIILTGPSGAGKTTTCKRFLESASGEWAYINQDEIRQLILAGYESAGDYYQNWNDGTKRQWAASIPICVDIAKRYSEYGINCILDIFAPPEEFERWKPFLKNLDYSLIVLLPDEETTVLRNAERDDRSKLKENKIRQNHALFGGWKNQNVNIIDTSAINLKESLEKIKRIAFPNHAH